MAKEYTVCHKYLEEALNNYSYVQDILSSIGSSLNDNKLRLNEEIEDAYIDVIENDTKNYISPWWLELQNHPLTKKHVEETPTPPEDLELYEDKLPVHYLYVAAKSKDERKVLIIREEIDYAAYNKLISKYGVKVLDKEKVYREF